LCSEPFSIMLLKAALFVFTKQQEVQWNRRSVFIKDIDNQNRSVSGQVLTKLQDHHSFVRVNGKTFWSCENKTQLVEFFMDEWSKQKRT
jgi:hypothetical protein